jgi:hypothetical protein
MYRRRSRSIFKANHEEQIMIEAIRRGLKGLQCAKSLDDNGLKPPPEWQVKIYVEAYRSGFAANIQSQKTNIRRTLNLPTKRRKRKNK